MTKEQQTSSLRMQVILTFCVTSQFVFNLYLFGSYISEYQDFTMTTLILTLSFVLSTLAFLPVMFHIIRSGVNGILDRLFPLKDENMNQNVMGLIEQYDAYLKTAGEEALSFTQWAQATQRKKDAKMDADTDSEMGKD